MIFCDEMMKATTKQTNQIMELSQYDDRELLTKKEWRPHILSQTVYLHFERI